MLTICRMKEGGSGADRRSGQMRALAGLGLTSAWFELLLVLHEYEEEATRRGGTAVLARPAGDARGRRRPGGQRR